MRTPEAPSRGLLAALVASAAAIAIAVMAGSALAQTDPPASGDWTVSDTTMVKDATVALDGNLLVTSTGRLTLENVTLLISETSNGEHGIEVVTGGSLTVRDGDGQKATAGDNSRISSDPTTFSFHFIVRSGSTLSITNALVEHCGYPGGTGNEQQGIFVATQNAVLRGVDVTACMYGLIVENGAVDAQDCTFSNCTYQGVYASGSTLSIVGCTMADDGYDGVRAIGGTTTIDRSSIFHCRYGAVARATAVLTIGNSTIDSNQGGVLVEQGFNVKIINCSIWGHTFYGIDAEYNGVIDIRDSQVSLSERAALYAFTNVQVTSSGSSYFSSVYGIRGNMNARITSTRDSIYSNTNSGVFLEQGSTTVLVGTTLSLNTVGVNADTGTSVVAWGATMDANVFEGYKLTGASLALHDGVVANCTSGGVVPDGLSTATWAVHAGNSSALIGCAAMLTGNMPVAGSLRLSRATLAFRTGPNGLVCDDGIQRWDNSTIDGTGAPNGFKLVIMGSASGIADHVKFDGVGYSEATPDTRGVHVDTAFTFRLCTFTNCLHGTAVTGGRVSFDRCSFSTNTLGASASGAQTRVRLENCSFSGNPTDCRLDSSAVVEMVNSSYNPAKVTFVDDASQMYVYWTVHAAVSYPSGQPSPAADVVVTDNDGTVVAGGTADAAGRVTGLLVLQSIVMRDATDDRTPHTFSATKGGAHVSEPVSVTSHMTVELSLTDPDLPVIVVASHADGDYLRSSVLSLRGTATDASSGILEVSVRISTQPWETALGTSSWQWTRVLPGDGTYPISVRARDLALNEAYVWLNLTLDTRPPRLYVESPPSPQNGSTVGTTTVELSGYVDDVTAMVSWNGVNATMQGSSFFINVTLAQGENLVDVIARDPAGNTATVVWRLIADLAVPPLRVDRPVNGDLYNTLDLDLEGTTQPGCQLYYRIEGRMTTWLLVTVNGLGAFVGKLTELGEGQNVINVRSRTPSGNEATSSITITIDTVDPVLVSVTPPDGAFVNVATIVLSGTFSEPIKVLSMEGHEAAIDGLNFTFSVPLRDGPNDISLVATDMAGNSGYKNMVINFDPNPPTVTLPGLKYNESSDSFNPVHTNKPNYVLSGQTDVGCTASVGGGSYPVDSRGAFAARLNLSQGRNNLTLVVTDRAGNTIRYALVVFLDTTPPELVVQTPADGARVIVDYIHVTGRTTPGDTITIGDESYTSLDGTFDMVVPIPSPINRLRIVASDLAGNTVSESRLVFRGSDTSGLTGIGLLDSNCLVLFIVLIVCSVGMGAAAAVTGRKGEAEEEDERKLKRIMDEESIEVPKPQYEPTTGSLEYEMGLYPSQAPAPAEPEDEEFVSMDDFRRQLEGGEQK